MNDNLNKYKISILRPGGNNTALVKGIVEKSERKIVNDSIMRLLPAVEQVGFYEYDARKKQGFLEMAGGEFCGNATRSTAYLALNGEPGNIEIKVSGVKGKLKAGVTQDGEAYAQMPIYPDPSYIVEDPDKPGNYTVTMEGIAHYVNFDTSEIVGLSTNEIKKKGMKTIKARGLDQVAAGGIIYVGNTRNGWKITPVVYVKAVDTKYLETACGSGTTALGMILALSKGKSISEVSILQPSGLPIKISVEFDGNRFGYAQIQGPIEKLNDYGLCNNTIKILKDLIEIPSYVDKEKNDAEVATYIKNFFKQLRNRYFIEEQKVENNRVNLIIKNSNNPKIILFGHMDTVLPKEETIKPFEPRIIGDKLYGLGATDMKSGLAIMLNQALKNKKKGLGLIFTADEEYEFKGSLKLIENYKFKPELIINLEPTNAEICSGCRGITEFSFTIHGKSVHAGRKHLGINAIEKTVVLTDKLQKSISKFDNKTIGKNSLNLAYLHGGVLQEVDKNGDKKISGLGMVVPDYAEANCEIRITSDKITTSFIKNELARLATSLEVLVKDISFKFYFGSMLTPKKHLKSFEKAFISSLNSIKYRDLSMSGFYEVQLLQERWGTNCVVFGPGPIELSHSANEYVSLASIESTEKVIEAYIHEHL